jgi:hypothetical protein
VLGDCGFMSCRYDTVVDRNSHLYSDINSDGGGRHIAGDEHDSTRHGYIFVQ